MKGRVLAVITAVVGAVWCAGVWRDTRPQLPMTTHELKNLKLAAPSHWEKPEQGTSAIFVRSKVDKKNRLDEFEWSLTIFDDGATDLDAVIRDIKRDMDESEGIRTIMLTNGIEAKTWVDWQPMGELNREVRAYAFKAGNGRVYSALQPLGRDWRVNRRYTNIFKEVLGSIEFKK